MGAHDQVLVTSNVLALFSGSERLEPRNVFVSGITKIMSFTASLVAVLGFNVD